MKIDLLNINQFIKQNNLKEVTNPIYFNIGNVPTDDGLFSFEIFGDLGSEERKKTFAYINLQAKFLHPVIYNIITSLDRKYIELINGSKYFKITERGTLEEDQEKGQTGLQFLYDNFDKIKFKETESSKRSEKLKLLKSLTKDEIFVDKWIIIPAFYRDYDSSSSTSSSSNKLSKDPINDSYTKLLRMGETLKNSDLSFDFVNNSTKSQMQNILVEIYSNLTKSLAKKEGIIHKSLIGKSVDYATRSVISTQRFKKKHWKDLTVPFGSVGVPLSQVCVLFFPFFIKWINDFIDQYIEDFSIVENKKGEKIEIKNVKEQFSDDKIKELINLFIKNTERRFSSIKVKDNDGNEYPVKVMYKDLKRKFTLMDLLYLAAYEICKDKHVYITRYPVESYQNIIPCRIVILTTTDTKEQHFGDKYFKDYPLIIPDYPCEEKYFIDTTIINNTYTKSLGADFDGRTIIINLNFI